MNHSVVPGRCAAALYCVVVLQHRTAALRAAPPCTRVFTASSTTAACSTASSTTAARSTASSTTAARSTASSTTAQTLAPKQCTRRCAGDHMQQRRRGKVGGRLVGQAVRV
eukprot:365651-Chlamydomonas_euryale.AAC.8